MRSAAMLCVSVFWRPFTDDSHSSVLTSSPSLVYTFGLNKDLRCLSFSSDKFLQVITGWLLPSSNLISCCFKYSSLGKIITRSSWKTKLFESTWPPFISFSMYFARSSFCSSGYILDPIPNLSNKLSLFSSKSLALSKISERQSVPK